MSRNGEPTWGLVTRPLRRSRPGAICARSGLSEQRRPDLGEGLPRGASGFGSPKRLLRRNVAAMGRLGARRGLTSRVLRVMYSVGASGSWNVSCLTRARGPRHYHCHCCHYYRPGPQRCCSHWHDTIVDIDLASLGAGDLYITVVCGALAWSNVVVKSTGILIVCSTRTSLGQAALPLASTAAAGELASSSHALPVHRPEYN